MTIIGHSKKEISELNLVKKIDSSSIYETPIGEETYIKNIRSLEHKSNLNTESTKFISPFLNREENFPLVMESRIDDYQKSSEEINFETDKFEVNSKKIINCHKDRTLKDFSSSKSHIVNESVKNMFDKNNQKEFSYKKNILHNLDKIVISKYVQPVRHDPLVVLKT